MIEEFEITGEIDKDNDFFLYIKVPENTLAISPKYTFLHGTAQISIGGQCKTVSISGQLNLHDGDQTRSSYFNVAEPSNNEFTAKINCSVYEYVGYERFPISLESGWISSQGIDCQTFSLQHASVNLDEDGDFIVNYTLNGENPFVASVEVISESDSDNGPIGEYFDQISNDGICYIYGQPESEQYFLVLHKFVELKDQFTVKFVSDAIVAEHSDNNSSPASDLCSDDSDDITVRFVLMKGEGDWPEIDELSDAEKTDPIQLAEFILDWDPDNLDDYDLTDVEIIEAQFLYDGISYLPKSDMGIIVQDNSLSGYPAPIIRFKLSRPVSPEAFVRAVSFSSVKISPESRFNAELDPFFCEDHNDYTDFVDLETFGSIINNELTMAEAAKITLDELMNGVQLSKVRTSPL